MTNPATRQCGIYETTIRIMAFETGYNVETIEKLIQRFEDYGKIKEGGTMEEVWKVFFKLKAEEILDFIDLYEKYEKRDSITELTQHVYWMFRDIKTSLRAKWVSECKTHEQVRAFLDRID